MNFFKTHMQLKHARNAIASCAVGLICSFSGVAHAAPSALQLPKVFSDNMVLQQDKPIRVWGFDVPGKNVAVTFNGQSQNTTADTEGAWRVSLPAMKADGKKHTLTVKGSTSITLNNVVLGEVWICSGQSNMEWGSGPELCKEANSPDLRLFCAGNRRIPLKADLTLPTGWAECQPDALEKGGSQIVDPKKGTKIKSFSRVGYQFGRDLQKELGVPVGMIQASLGGSMIISWTPQESSEKEFPFGKEMPITESQVKKQPGALYHLLVQPLTQLSVRGVIWYQGENDGDNPAYEQQLQQMITSWRSAFRDPDMHFYMVQISASSFHGGMLGVWEAQRRAVAALTNCGVSVNNDIYQDKESVCSVDPETNWPLQGQVDPHPPNHPVIAKRLTNIALQKVYGKTMREAYGPMYKSIEIRGDKVILTFDNVGEGLKSTDGKELNWFEVSDGSQKNDSGPYVYTKAVARVIGKNQIEVHSPQVAAPKHVRFSWHMFARNNLVNSEGLPGFPFRTDDYTNPRER
jgi:sialate O-acetylesterase